jgi:serine/threonine protein kinase
MPVTTGEPVLSDLGEARIAYSSQTGLIMPSVYRAPEVMLGMEWNNKVDIWAVGQMVQIAFLSRLTCLCSSLTSHRHGPYSRKDIFSKHATLTVKSTIPSGTQRWLHYWDRHPPSF